MTSPRITLVGYILSPLVAVVKGKPGEGTDPIPETERLWLVDWGLLTDKNRRPKDR